MKKKFLIALFLILLFPALGRALNSYTACHDVSSGVCVAPTYTVCFDGLVPCGKKVWYQVGAADCNNTAGMNTTTTHCQLCHFFIMFNVAVDFLIWKIALPLAALMIIIGGILYLLALLEFLPGGPQTLNQARQLLTGVFIGIFIIFAAWFLINIFFTLIGVADWTGLKEGWFEIDCPVKL